MRYLSASLIWRESPTVNYRQTSNYRNYFSKSSVLCLKVKDNLRSQKFHVLVVVIGKTALRTRAPAPAHQHGRNGNLRARVGLSAFQTDRIIVGVSRFRRRCSDARCHGESLRAAGKKEVSGLSRRLRRMIRWHGHLVKKVLKERLAPADSVQVSPIARDTKVFRRNDS
jgi:hypothetical protein